jgi:hypothetical protein
MKASAMRDYEIGYGQPPKSTMFAPKRSGNPKGRPPRKSSEMCEIVDAFLNAPMEYREGGSTKTATRQEIQLKLVVRRAISGDVKAAEQLLQTFDRSRRSGEGSTTGWSSPTGCRILWGKPHRKKTAFMREPPLNEREEQRRSDHHAQRADAAQ